MITEAENNYFCQKLVLLKTILAKIFDWALNTALGLSVTLELFLRVCDHHLECLQV